VKKVYYVYQEDTCILHVKNQPLFTHVSPRNKLSYRTLSIFVVEPDRSGAVFAKEPLND